MAYVKIIFQNSPSTATPMNAENLNHMDDQIALNDQRLTEIETSYVKSFNGRKGEVVPENGDYDIGQIAPLTGAQVGQVPVVTNIGTEEDPELVFRMGAGGGAGGHEIIDSEGNIMPQESAMQFVDLDVTDNSINQKTVVSAVNKANKSDLASISETGSTSSQAISEGTYFYLNNVLVRAIDDIASGDTFTANTNYEVVTAGALNEVSRGSVSVSIDGVKTWSQLFNYLYSIADLSKITENAKIIIDRVTSKLIYSLGYVNANRYSFMYTIASATSIETNRISLYDNSDFFDYNTSSGVHTYNNDVPTNTAWTIKLYY